MATSSGTKAMGSLFDLMLDFVNTSRMHDANYDIAQTLIEHYDELPQMSLRRMADLCYVSQASFSRFCRFLGFESFGEFKEAMDGANYLLADDYSRGFRSQLAENPACALKLYRSELVSILNGALDEKTTDLVPSVLDALEQAQRVVFFSHHFLWHIGRYFQGKMLQLGKYVELYQYYEHQEEAARTLQEGDVAIVCSINGSYFSHYQDVARAVFGSGAKVVVLTQNRHALYINRADYMLLCGNTNENDIGKYAALMTIDYLVMAYMRRIEQRGNEWASMATKER